MQDKKDYLRKLYQRLLRKMGRDKQLLVNAQALENNQAYAKVFVFNKDKIEMYGDIPSGGNLEKTFSIPTGIDELIKNEALPMKSEGDVAELVAEIQSVYDGTINNRHGAGCQCDKCVPKEKRPQAQDLGDELDMMSGKINHDLK